MKAIGLVLLTLSLGVHLSAQEYVNDQFQFAISFPQAQGWAAPEVKTAASGALRQPQQLVLVASRRSGERVTIQVLDVGDAVTLDDRGYREGFREGTVKSFPPSFRLTSDRQATFAGAPGYEMLIGGSIQDLPIHIRMVAIVANRLQYNISGYARQPENLTDGDVARVLSSFRFTQPPQLPRARPAVRTTAELVGRLTVYAVVAILLALLALVALRRKKTL